MARAIAWWRTGDRAKATRFAEHTRPGVRLHADRLGLYRFLLGDVLALWLVRLMGFFIIQAARAADVQSQITARIEGLRVSDVMDREPVAVPADVKLDRALDEYFLRYG